MSIKLWGHTILPVHAQKPLAVCPISDKIVEESVVRTYSGQSGAWYRCEWVKVEPVYCGIE